MHHSHDFKGLLNAERVLIVASEWRLFAATGEGGNVTVLEYYDLDDVDKWEYAGIEAVFVVAFFFLAFLALFFMKHSAR